ncbi:uncharacterized protein LOC131323356 isoform X2 [Rhododendron vialii]|uniref:uncharacterized protein LOC131323356 isoform X2 n=1 Tax=Rhododendron vialii TaxID=182163 RepID=UPI00265E11EF|nr:uncharacterized protein LOC131323356 isoform X2 [Rhododendron vialii]
MKTVEVEMCINYKVYHTQRLGEGALQSGSYTLKRFIHSTSVHPIQLFSSGERPKAETVAETIVGNRAELVHFPSSLDPHVRLTSKDCPNCVGSMKRDVGREDAAIDSEHGLWCSSLAWPSQCHRQRIRKIKYCASWFHVLHQRPGKKKILGNGYGGSFDGFSGVLLKHSLDMGLL